MIITHHALNSPQNYWNSPQQISSGLEEFYEALSKSLMTEYCLPRQKGRRTRKGSAQPTMASNSLPALPLKQFKHNTEATFQSSPGTSSPHTAAHVAKVSEIEITSQTNRQEMFSWVVILLLIGLIAFNVILYVKLWRLDENHESSDNEFSGHRMEFLR